jgi:drug/metabolite transporter (DMT)-like permease
VSLVTVWLAIGATLSWALTWALMKAGVDRMSWVGFGFLRPWMGLPFILLYALATGGFSFVSPTAILAALGGGFLNAFLGTALFYYALHHGSMHETNILANTSPFWGVVSAIVVLGERATLVAFGAGGLVLAGTVFLVHRRDRSTHARSLPALLAALGAGIAWGFSTAVPTKLCVSQGMSPITYQLLFTAGGAVCWTLAALPGLARRTLIFTRKGVWIALVSSFFGLFAGWVLWLTALKQASASALSPLSGLTLLFATVLGVVFLRQPLTRRMIAGGVLVLAGVTLVSVLAT